MKNAINKVFNTLSYSYLFEVTHKISMKKKVVTFSVNYGKACRIFAQNIG